MKNALIITTLLTVLTGCAGTGGHTSGGMASESAAARGDTYQQEQDRIFQSWID